MKIFLATLALLTLATPSGAEHCETWTTTAPVIDVGVPNADGGADRYYVDDYFDMSPAGGMPLPYVYQEANGIDGLQRADEIVDDTCHGMIAPDRLIF